MNDLKKDNIIKSVRESYKNIAVESKSKKSCCGGAPKLKASASKVSTSIGYSKKDITSVPEESNMGLGCGNPQLIANLKEGETVLDLGSGGGFDSFLAANKVGENGHVIGVDMTPEMISKARSNIVKGNYKNVEFRLGEIENLPVADNIVDVIISNCVINLSPNKQRVYNEAYRVLKTGGRIAISDVILINELTDEMKNDEKLYCG
ncbi:putative arsenite methyltransferase [Gottschalkia purinilytica]|uniref:Arsenite methyltransferase n=2 Tax=Gottschalkia purinilytica TaxID=1503 RepID=A0A0L0WET3_GOTPU|nr:putative arsenite methyltransferase [Gottschalkia purinilytica]